MSQVKEENQESFKWGDRIDVNTEDSELKRYKSFNYQGVHYSLYDCVYLYREGAKDTDIGKLVKIWETKKGGKRGKVIWFFRPVDICFFLRDYEPSWNELFLASGVGKGVSNIIPLEAIVGKCNVLCTAKDRRNTLLSKSELGKANYYVSHIFDVGDLRVSDKFPDNIDMIKVERLFNWNNQDKPKANADCRTGLTAGVRLKEKPTHTAEKRIMVEKSCIPEYVENREKPKIYVECRNGFSADALVKAEEKYAHTAENPIKGEVSSVPENCEPHTLEVQPLKKTKQLPTVSPSQPSQDIRRWFYMLPWENRVKDAHQEGTLVHLINLNPSHTASDVQEIISMAFKVKVDAKILPRMHSSDIYGHALVIFESKDDADYVMFMLNQKCLMVGEGRPLVACESTLNEPGITKIFPGHFNLNKLNYKSFKRKAVSTSHCSQVNTIEHEMAMQWRVLQKKSDLCWEALHEEQAKEFSECLNLMMKNCKSDGPDRTTVEATPAPEAALEVTSAPKPDESNRTAEPTSSPVSPVERPYSASHPAASL